MDTIKDNRKKIEQNNSPPDKQIVRTMCGIDSLHLLIECSILELTALIKKSGLGVSFERRNNWTTEYKIILAGEKIRIVTVKRQCRIEFGGLYYSRNSENKLDFIRYLTQSFPRWKISRLDFACDLKVEYQTVVCEVPKGFKMGKQYRNTVYYNRKTRGRTYTICIYDRSRRSDFFSFPLTRIELRLYRNGLSNRKIQSCLLEYPAFEKCANFIDKIFHEVLTVRVKDKPVLLKINSSEILGNFIEFLQSDTVAPRDKDLFHLNEAFIVRDKVMTYMKNKGLSWKNLPRHCKMKQIQVCQQIGISQPILRKALEFAKGA